MTDGECEYHDSICVAIFGLDPEMDCGADGEHCQLRCYLNSPQFRNEFVRREDVVKAIDDFWLEHWDIDPEQEKDWDSRLKDAIHHIIRTVGKEKVD